MPLLQREPPGDVGSLDDLLGIALAMEEEAVRRYTQLADLMDGRDAADTAAVFHALAMEEREHAVGIVEWAGRLGRSRPNAPPFVWRLPPEIAASWEDLTDRTRVTPYQTLSLAVVNEQRAVAYFSYIAADAPNDEVRGFAEALAAEELNHAALLRRERRKAFRRQEERRPALRDADPEDLKKTIADRYAEAAGLHAALALALVSAGDPEGASTLTRIAGEEAAMAGTDATPERSKAHLPASAGEILRAAMGPCEELSELLSDIAGQTGDEALMLHAQAAMGRTVGHLVSLAAELRRLGR